jgi:small GTP-binding protein
MYLFDYIQPTVGIDFVTKTMQVDGETLRLQLWDTAGQERFRSLIPSYVRDADICLIIVDLSVRTSF